MRVGWVLGLTLLSSSCAHFECTLHGGDEVRSIKTDHFLLTSDLPEQAHRAQAERLELLWDTFSVFFGADVQTAEVPVVVLRSTTAVESFSSGYYSGFVRRVGPTVLVVGAVASSKDAHDTNAHELTHLVSAFLLPRQPRWLSEGLATLFEDATFKSARTVKMGGWNEGRALEALQDGVLSLEELSEWNGMRFDSQETLFYASAWAWVRYLSNHEEAKLKRFFDGLRGTRTFPQLMAELFPPAESKRLHEAVKAYLASARYREWETSLRRTPTLQPPVVLLPWEVHALRSKLYLQDEDAARKEQQKAVALAPRPLPPRAAVLKVESEKRDPKELLATYPTAGPVLVAAYGHFDESVDDAKVQEALKGEDADVELLLLAANSALYGAGDLERATKLADHGGALAPWSSEFAFLRTIIALQKNECAEADLRASRVATLMSERPSESELEQLKKLRERVAACK
jgi:hypothetical protein